MILRLTEVWMELPHRENWIRGSAECFSQAPY